MYKITTNKKSVTAPILKPTDDHLPETFWGGPKGLAELHNLRYTGQVKNFKKIKRGNIPFKTACYWCSAVGIQRPCEQNRSS